MGDQIFEEIAIPPSPAAAGDRDAQKEAILHARGYQLEMLKESLEQNVIVAMDTGSGKTQVAVLRIQAELELSPGKLVWFMAPTIALCYQQFEEIDSQILGVTKIISGNDGPETWSTAQIWNAVLTNVSVVVSTPEVLSQALLHGFLNMERLSLIVLDEAHNYTGNNPGSKVMGHYRKAKTNGLPVPAILGLTASPVVKTSSGSLEIIEQTLDAVCKTPVTHRSELLAQVNRPDLSLVSYEPVSSSPGLATQAMESLQSARNAMDIRQDPYVQQKLLEIQSGMNVERAKEDLRKAVCKNSTDSIRQLNSLCRRSLTVRCELGSWAADYFIRSAVTEFLDYVSNDDLSLATWNFAEKSYLANILKGVRLPQKDETGDPLVTHKVMKLMERLLESPVNSLGIIFVNQISTARSLCALLSSHPSTCTRYRIGTMFGLSQNASRKGEIGGTNRKDSLINLQKFREGKINLLIATSVLEEGIDVPACNLVVCFDQPSNLKSFIQRRGRARQKNSKLILLCGNISEVQTTWEDLEQDMKRQYAADRRKRKELEELEESKDGYFPTFCTKSGNEMDIDQARGHLDHFCSALFSKRFVECRPYYVFQRTYTTRTKSELPLIKATVVLPNSLLPDLRRVDSACAWYSEKKACKDAAFEAYKKLYEAGLVNEHLLPFKEDELVQDFGTRLSEEQVSDVWNPWFRVAKLCSMTERIRYTICLTGNGQELCRFDFSLPMRIPTIPPFKVFWNKKSWTAEIQPATDSIKGTSDSPTETMALLALAFGHRRLEIREQAQHVINFHSKKGAQLVEMNQLGGQSFSSMSSMENDGCLPYLIRNCVTKKPYFFDKWLPSQPVPHLIKKKLQEFDQNIIEENGGMEGPWLALRSWPRRRDFLHEIPGSKTANSEQPYQTAWPVSCCDMDTTPIINVQFGSLIPSIVHVVEIYLVAQELSDTVLKELRFQDLTLLLTAISASSAREVRGDYQKLEFLGDAILKLLSTISVVVNYPQFPEGYLTKMRVGIVSNARLCRSTKDAGIDKFILTKEFTGDKWQPLYVDDLLEEEVLGSRILSSKVLADVVESLAGASFEDGGRGKPGMIKALQCLNLFIPNNKWHSLEEARHLLLLTHEPRSDLPANLVALEKLLGYTFTHKNLLVEAVTHSSYTTSSASDKSYDRLEFIGDAILDYVVVLKLWGRGLSQGMMSSLRAACVNADLLGFLGMEWNIPQTTADVVDGQVVSTTVNLPFWKFMRHSSPEIGAVQKAVEGRHAAEREAILDAIRKSHAFPWALLAHLHAPKFFSDIFESVIGAVWLDSGDMDCCTAIAERIGILPYLERILDEDVDVIHPKNKLEELAREKTVRYEVDRGVEGMTRSTCRVFIENEMVVEVADGLYNYEVITKAAERACLICKKDNSLSQVWG